MRILSYSHAYPGGGHNAGGETTLHDVMRTLRLEGHLTTALLSKPHKNGEGSYVLDGVHVQAHGSRMDPEFYFPANDVVITHLECGLRVAKYKHLNKKIIHLIHNEQPYCIDAAKKNADMLVFNTDWVKHHYVDAGCDQPSVVLHPMVDPKRYKVETSREYITLVNLTVGDDMRVSYNKGARTFYEMARRFPDEKFLGVKGAYGNQHIEDLPNVTIVDHTDNILEIYRKTKVILLPSKYESYGRVPVEAACSGIPSVLSVTLGTVEAMGHNACYAQFGDYDEWEFMLNRVLANYQLWADRAEYQAHHNWDRTVAEWINFKETLESIVD